MTTLSGIVAYSRSDPVARKSDKAKQPTCPAVEVFKTLRVEDNWFCRADILRRFDDAYYQFAQFVLDRGVDYENDMDGLLECLDDYFGTDQWTEDEVMHLREQAIYACAYKDLINEGALKEIAPGKLRAVKPKSRVKSKSKK